MSKSLLFSLLCLTGALSADSTRMPKSEMSATYTVKDYSNLLKMKGFTNELLKMHFQLYAGYVKNSNDLIQMLNNWDLSDKSQTYAFTALKRRLGWEMDGMRLHELYFGNLGGTKEFDTSSPLYNAIVNQFGSYDKWKQDFIATGMTRGIGWVILYRDPQNGRLINAWINEHDVGHLAGGEPILVMDVFEHAYMPQFGLSRDKYITAFFDNIDWDTVTVRYE